MHFGLDFDDTITADDMLWDILIPLIIKACLLYTSDAADE